MPLHKSVQTPFAIDKIFHSFCRPICCFLVFVYNSIGGVVVIAVVVIYRLLFRESHILNCFVSSRTVVSESTISMKAILRLFSSTMCHN